MGEIQMLAITGNRISVVSLLGFIILIGIVVNNGIVLISYINMLIRRGIKISHALVAAGKSRLRPVVSTSCTTAIGMLPMALSTGDGSEVWVPIGFSVIGGLFVSTIMTLVLMPVLYSLLQRWLVPAELR
jgi:HAE1 family hydrophobic/amphiphilic exporter-1